MSNDKPVGKTGDGDFKDKDFDSIDDIGVAAKLMVKMHENPYEEAERLRVEARSEAIERLCVKEVAISRALEDKVAFEAGKKRPALETLDPLQIMGEGILKNTGPFIKKRVTLAKLLENYARATGYRDMAYSQFVYNVVKKLSRIGVVSVQQFVIQAPRINDMLKAEGYERLNGMTMEKLLKLCVTALHHYEIDGLKKCHFSFRNL
jgi:hypothetical protein